MLKWRTKNTDALEEERRGGCWCKLYRWERFSDKHSEKKRCRIMTDTVFAFNQLASCAECSEENFPLCWGKAIKRLVFPAYKRWIIEMLCLD